MSADELIRIGFATIKNHPVLLKKLTLLMRSAKPLEYHSVILWRYDSGTSMPICM